MPLPPKLHQIIELFRTSPRELRVQALLDYSKRVPPLPARLAEHPELLEKVPECQTPFFLATEVAGDGEVTIHFDCPPEAPTVRGYAGILHEGLAGATATEVLDIPDDFYMGIGLEEVVTPLRLRGMGAIVARLKRQVREQAGPSPTDETDLIPVSSAPQP
ncbi:MAG: SufE family protein [Acidimicrobiia bacterium]